MEVVMTTSLWSLTGGNKLRGRLYCRNLTITNIAMAVDELLVFYIL